MGLFEVIYFGSDSILIVLYVDGNGVSEVLKLVVICVWRLWKKLGGRGFFRWCCVLVVILVFYLWGDIFMKCVI